eukprot:TRINITY_DN644_c0_g1_i13.p1 TRINITY_DN644_c0_g1~~TRINITY_DN644_c0_g1_i13.p1  ORF type:complete len:212 (+),score=44.15 TRINITY_DN644_c0_g1_i13:210-845(+)
MEKLGDSLLRAAEDGDEPAVDGMILAAECTLDYSTPEGWTALIMASKAGHVRLVRKLLNAGASPNPSRVCHTAIRAGALGGHVQVMECLLARRADPNMASEHGRTALMGAAMNGHPECVQLLLQAGAELDLKNDHGETAADLAATYQHDEIVQLLKRARATSCTFCGGAHAYFECPDGNFDGPDTFEELCAGMQGENLIQQAIQEGSSVGL